MIRESGWLERMALLIERYRRRFGKNKKTPAKGGADENCFQA